MTLTARQAAAVEASAAAAAAAATAPPPAAGSSSIKGVAVGASIELSRDEALEVLRAAVALRAAGMDGECFVHGWVLQYKSRPSAQLGNVKGDTKFFHPKSHSKLYSIPTLRTSLGLSDRDF